MSVAGDTTIAGKLTVTSANMFLDLTKVTSGTGSPQGVLTAPVGSVFLRTDGAAGTTIYSKETGAGNTGWVPVITSIPASVTSRILQRSNTTSTVVPNTGTWSTALPFNTAVSDNGTGVTYGGGIFTNTNANTIAIRLGFKYSSQGFAGNFNMKLALWVPGRTHQNSEIQLQYSGVLSPEVTTFDTILLPSETLTIKGLIGTTQSAKTFSSQILYLFVL